MPRPDEQVNSIRTAIERQKAARDAAREAARSIDRERQQPVTTDSEAGDNSE